MCIGESDREATRAQTGDSRETTRGEKRARVRIYTHTKKRAASGQHGARAKRGETRKEHTHAHTHTHTHTHTTDQPPKGGTHRWGTRGRIDDQPETSHIRTPAGFYSIERTNPHTHAHTHTTHKNTPTNQRSSEQHPPGKDPLPAAHTPGPALKPTRRYNTNP